MLSHQAGWQRGLGEAVEAALGLRDNPNLGEYVIDERRHAIKSGTKSCV